MATLKISDFRGLLPKSDPRKLPAGFAQTANNVRFDAGDLSPIRRSEHEGYLSGNCGSLVYHHDDQEGSDAKFIEFGEDFDVTFVRSPVPDDSHHRLYWNLYKDNVLPSDHHLYGLHAISKPLSNPSPAFAASSVGSVGSPSYQQFRGYRVGIPAPEMTPRVSDVTPTAEVDFGGVENLSISSPITVSLAGDPPFEDGMKVRFIINSDHPVGEEQPAEGVPPEDGAVPETSTVGRIWSLNMQEGNVSAIGESGSATFDVIGVSGSDLGTEALTAEELGDIKIERVLTDRDMQDVQYVFTYVSEFDEEGPPSPPSSIVTVPKVGFAVDVTLRDSSFNYTEHGGDRRNVTKIRLYRSEAGSSSVSYHFVDEIEMPGANPESHWLETFTDSVTEIELGELLQSEKWYPPPPMMRGVKMLPNGFMVGFKGNTLYFSEPYLPHAWNPDYRLTTDDDILGVESYGSTLVVGTRGRPYVATGTDPASVRLQKLDEFAPLMHPKAMVDAGNGVLYPSTTGLRLVNRAGAKNITENHFDKKTWEEYLSVLKKGVFHDGRIIFFAAGYRPLILDMNGGKAELSRLDSTVEDHDYQAACIAGHDLVLVRKRGAVYDHMVRFKVDSFQNETLVWRSGLLTLQKAANMGVGQVFASGYPLTLHLAHADLQAGQPDLENMTWRQYTVNGPEPFRLPSDYLSREFSIGVDGEHRVQQITICSSMAELAAQ